MDGNRRFARARGTAVINGHIKGVETASNVLMWWLKFLPYARNHKCGAYPKYLTLWAFSSDNFKRPKEEVDGLLRLMTAEFKSLAFASLIHLFKIRVRVIGGDRSQFPVELVNVIKLLEESTREYDYLHLLIALGYGGREEIISSVQRVLKRGLEINEMTIGSETYCGRINVPPVDLIIRTSERRYVT